MKKSVLVSLLMLGSVATANAAPLCYHTNEAEAEQAMRYQAKLMVLSDTCRSDAYTQFVHRNASVISGYQHDLIGYYRRADGRHAENAFDSYITRLANEYALGAGKEPLASLCAKSAEFLSQAPNLGKDEFRHYVVAQMAVERPSHPACANERLEAGR